jgi:hypothetical protein
MQRWRPARAAYHAAQQIEDLYERRNAVAAASRNMGYFAERLRTALAVKCLDPSRFFILPHVMAVAFQKRIFQSALISRLTLLRNDWIALSIHTYASQKVMTEESTRRTIALKPIIFVFRS